MMELCVYGATHLGRVMSAVMASVGHQVTLLADEFPEINEPGLADLESRCFSLKRSSDRLLLRNHQVVWVCLDTPIDADGQAHPEQVLADIHGLFPYLVNGTLMLVSSQLPVGSIAVLEDLCKHEKPRSGIRWGCLPENLRVGKAIQNMREPDRFAVGLRHLSFDAPTVRSLLSPLFLEPRDGLRKIVYMSVESAEFLKHALNTWLALSVVYANELAALAKAAGADPQEVARGLLTEERVGPKAYLNPGNAYGGGHLQRDVDYLEELATRHELAAPVITSISLSNEMHKAGQL